MPRKTQSDAPDNTAKVAALANATPGETQTASAPLAVSRHRAASRRRAKAPRNHRELAQAIFEQCDAVSVGRELLESSNERGNSVKARVWETLVDFLFGKQQPPSASSAAASASANVRIVWDLPAPPHENERDAPRRESSKRDNGDR